MGIEVRRSRPVLLTVAMALVVLVGSSCGSSTSVAPAGHSVIATTSPIARSSLSSPADRPPTAGSGPSATTTGPVLRVSSSLLGKDLEVIPTKKKIVALTFDAGANADGLPSILSSLSAGKVPASFFLTGTWAAGHPAAVQKLVAGGYRLGNHTATHPHLTKLSDAAVRTELTRGRSQILAAGGSSPQPWFRFPFGDRNAHAISVVNKAGYAAIRWSVDTLGWKGTSGGMTKKKVVDRAVGAARPGEIVLMHVGSNPDDKTTLDATALPTIISRLKGLGYGFVTLDALLGSGAVPPACDSTAWRSAPITINHEPAVPPVPVVTGIRTATHPECGYDRLVLDIEGAHPGYEIRSVATVTVTADPSGQPVTVPGGGSTYLVISLHPAVAHTESGAATLSPTSSALGYPALKGYALSGDTEGYVSVALGLVGTRPIRTGELAGRLYVDVAH